MIPRIQKVQIFLRSRLRSFSHAFSGLRDMLVTEPNAWIHAAVTSFVLFMCWWLQVSRDEFAHMVLAIITVWAAEAFNTVLEITLDFVSSKQYSPVVKRVKDISAAAVLVASMGATVVGIVILGPLLWVRITAFFRV
jgi:diacylglycerol kinase